MRPQIASWELDVASRQLTWSGPLRRLLEVADAYPPSIERMLDFCTPESRGSLSRAIETARRDGADFELETPVVTAAGRNLHLRTFARVESRDGHPVRILGVLQDLTALRERETAQRRLELEVLAQEKAEMLAAFAGSMAHDFNNLLTGIMGYHELIACDLGDNTQVQDYIVQARQACLRARNLLEQMLAFTRQTAAAPPTPLDLAAFITAAQPQLRALVPETVSLEHELAADPLWGSANAVQIRLVLLNLGIHLTRPLAATGGSLFIRLRRAGREDSSNVAFASLPSGDFACLSIGNVRNLTGAPVERRVFERSLTTAEAREDGGLEVAIAFRIVRAHHGALGLESDAGGGSEFRIYLPLVAPSSRPPAASPPRPAADGGETIFIVDDEETVATFMRYALQATGYRVTTFATPASCLDALAVNPAACDLLITDQTMPGLTGFELVNRVRQLSPQVPALIMSGNFLELPEGLRHASPPTEILQKPFAHDELRATVHRFLHARPA